MIDFGFQNGGGGGSKPIVNAFASLYDTSDQSVPGASNPRAMYYNSANGISNFQINNDTFGKPSIIQNSVGGTYNLQFSAQVVKSAGGGSEDIDIWLRLNGVDINWSNTRLTLSNNGHFVVASWNWVFSVKPLTEIQIMWATSGNTISLQSDPATAYSPEIPSVIATITKVVF